MEHRLRLRGKLPARLYYFPLCGRFRLTRDSNIAEPYGIKPKDDRAPRYNIAPTQDVEVIRPSAVAANCIDLSQIDFELLKRQFDTGRKAIKAPKLRSQIALKVGQMVQLNKTRMNFLEEFQRMIDEYNFGTANVETLFAQLMVFAQRLSEEEKRGISGQLTEEELTIFDLLTKPEFALTKAEERERRSPKTCWRSSRVKSLYSPGRSGRRHGQRCGTPLRPCSTSFHAHTRRSFTRRSATWFTSMSSMRTMMIQPVSGYAKYPELGRSSRPAQSQRSATEPRFEKDVTLQSGSGWSPASIPPVVVRLLGISKRDNKYLRRMFIHGARSVLLRARQNTSGLGQWIRQLEARVPRNKVAVALDNKLARITWAVLAKGEGYRAEAAAAA